MRWTGVSGKARANCRINRPMPEAEQQRHRPRLLVVIEQVSHEHSSPTPNDVDLGETYSDIVSRSWVQIAIFIILEGGVASGS